VDAMGEVVMDGGNEEFVKTIVLEKSGLDSIREKLPFLRDRDAFNISL